MYKKQTLPFPSAGDYWFWTRGNLVIALFLATTTNVTVAYFATVQKAHNPLSLTKINLYQCFAAIPSFLIPVTTHTSCFTTQG